MTPFGIRRRLRNLGQRLFTLVDREPVQQPPSSHRALNPVRQALDTLRHGEYHDRIKSAAKLGDLGDSTAIDGLINALRDQAAEVAAAAAASLGQLHAKQAADPLRDVAANGDGYFDTLTRRAAIDALVEVAGLEAVPTLLSLIRDIDADVSRYAIENLGRLGDQRAARPLWDVVQNSDNFFLSTTRCAAVDAVAKINETLADEGEDATARAFARDSLSRLANEDFDPDVRACAERALAS